jgi:hypothetical protein
MSETSPNRYFYMAHRIFVNTTVTNAPEKEDDEA